MHAERHTIAVEVSAGGAATAYSPNITGRVHSISYVKDDYADTVDWAITLEATGESLWTDTNITASERVYPVAPANVGSSGAASSLTEVPIVAANDRVKFVISNGGVSTSGVFHVVVT